MLKEPVDTDYYQTVKTETREMVWHLNKQGDKVAIFFSESNKLLSKNARAMLDSYDLEEWENVEVGEQEFNQMLLDFAHLIYEDKEGDFE